MIPPAILPVGAAQHVVRLDDWRWNDAGLEHWTRQQLPDALERRCREFAAGRVCAAQVIRALTGTAGPAHHIGRTASGAPAWPRGLVGSIAHSRQLAGAVALRHPGALGIGLDIEPVMAAGRADTVAPGVATTDELAVLQQAARLTRAAAVTLAFAVKEALFKCLHPLAGTMFSLLDAQLETVDLPDGLPADQRTSVGRVDVRLLTDLSSDITARRLFRASVAFDAGVVYTVVSI